MQEKAEKLIGKIINKIECIADNSCIQFYLDNNEIMEFFAQGDCCSESWIEHFDELKEPATIIEFKEIPVPPTFVESPTKTGNYEESMEYYFYELVTDKGSFMFEMRNSSNGYYGGYLQ